ncbi:MAG: hypothetical protein KTR26_21740 [Flammeovirgaceae bacterium]|nr:hypothetical protein [Flammeovirgaceae bacterium]
MSEQLKTQEKKNKDLGIEPAVSKKYDAYISAIIVIGALLLVGLVILNADVVW